MEPLNKHIKSFNPSISLYRREHASHRRYLSGDINIKLIYADYLEKGNSCSFESYRKAIQEKNISFTKRGEEECEEVCEECLLQDQRVKGDHHFTELGFLQKKFELKGPTALRPHHQKSLSSFANKQKRFLTVTACEQRCVG